MNLTELKSKAYDILANIEYLQKELQNVNQAIAEEMKKQQEESEN